MAELAPEGAASTPPPRRFRTDVFMMTGAKGVVILSGAVQSIILARALGPLDRGTVAVAFSFAALIAQLGTLGLQSANPFYAAREPEATGRLIANSLWFAAGLGAVLVAIGCVVKAIFPGAVAGIDWPELLISLISVPAMLAYTFLQAILLGRGRTVGYNVGDVVLAIVPLILFVVGFAVFDMGVIGSLAIFSGAQIAASLFYLAILMRDQPAVRQPDFELMRRMLSFGLRAYLISVASYLVVRVDVLLVNGYLDEGQAGIYAIAVGLADLVALAPTIIAVNLFPRVARGGGVQMTAEVFRSVSVLFGLLCLVSIPVASVMVSVLYGSDFSTAAEIYYWLVPGVFALGMVSILSHHFAGHGIPGVIGVYWVIALVINVVMNVALLADHGTYIASLASSVCYMLVFLLCLRLFAKQAGGWSILRPSGREVVRFVRQSLSRTPA